MEKIQQIFLKDVATMKQNLIEQKTILENQMNIKAIRDEMRSLQKLKSVIELKMFHFKYYKTPSEAQQLELISTGLRT